MSTIQKLPEEAAAKKRVLLALARGTKGKPLVFEVNGEKFRATPISKTQIK